MKIEDQIRNYLISFRKEKRLTQEEMADLVGIKLRTYVKIDKTGVIGTVEDVYKLIEFTGIDIVQIVAQSKNIEKKDLSPDLSIKIGETGQEVSGLNEKFIDLQAKVDVLLVIASELSLTDLEKGDFLISPNILSAINLRKGWLLSEASK